MNILLTNDDGIDAEGINSLYNILSEKHTVFIMAPDRERSACSNAFTIYSEMVVKKYDDNKFSTTGYPADCIGLAINSGLIPEIDLFISGINHGPNLGEDIFFSGTVAGARTAHIFNKSGIAVSLNSMTKESDYFDDAAQFILNLISKLPSDIKQKPIFYNINYPDLPTDKIKGKKYTYLGKRIYSDEYERIEENDNTITLKIKGGISSIPKDGNDFSEVNKGYISITPLILDCTDFNYIEKNKLSD